MIRRAPNKEIAMSGRYDEQAHVTLTRDCAAVVVPWGTPVVLDAGSEAQITQRLGGTFTVVIGGNMYRIDGKDADALGHDTEEDAASSAPSDHDVGEMLSAEEVRTIAWSQLGTCYDPEIPIDIVNLGLVYGCEVLPLENKRFRIEVKMTLTAPGCGMGTLLADEARNKLLAIRGVEEVEVDLVWDPPWDREMMSEMARLEMGMM
jgi:probable FeS assembly SUF system protein SufT